MKLAQLRYLVAIVEAGFSISAAAARLHISQPGVSRQLKLLEDELGLELFVRDGRNLSRLTPEGQRVFERAQRVLRETQAIKSMSLDARDPDRGSISIATTHTQARSVLPEILTGMRIGLGVAWLVVVAAEMIVRSSGLGYLIMDSRNAGNRYDLVVAAMIIIGLIGLGLDVLMRRLEGLRGVRWRYGR